MSFEKKQCIHIYESIQTSVLYFKIFFTEANDLRNMILRISNSPVMLTHNSSPLDFQIFSEYFFFASWNSVAALKRHLTQIKLPH